MTQENTLSRVARTTNIKYDYVMMTHRMKKKSRKGEQKDNVKVIDIGGQQVLKFELMLPCLNKEIQCHKHHHPQDTNHQIRNKAPKYVR